MPEMPQRVKTVSGHVVPLYPEECEPHTETPTGYLQWDEWAEQMNRTHVQRQCKGCGLWAVWELRQPDGNGAAHAQER